MTSMPEHLTPRRSFLGRITAGAVALAAGVKTLDAETIGASTASPFDESWLNTLNGKHKQMVDAQAVNDGWPLAFAGTFLNSNHEAYNLPDNQITSVVVLRHFAMPLALNDATWAKYHIGDMIKMMDPQTKTPSARNIYFKPKQGDMMMDQMSIDKLMARGVVFVACNVALTVLSGMAAKGAGVTADVAKKEWIAGLHPGVHLAASGVLAVNRSQEKGCTYCAGGG
ncbi:MAG: hypothetical protein M3081_20610 [Gemmatimonadota bacterium]|nr:hypothetical protein [Gemmatimonadota bacterium]